MAAIALISSKAVFATLRAGIFIGVERYEDELIRVILQVQKNTVV